MSEPQTGLPLPGLRWRGFTLQMFLFTILPLAALLLLIAFGSLSLHHDSMRALVGDRDLRAVRAAANSLSDEIEHRALTLELYAAQPGSRETALPGFDGGLARVSADGTVTGGTIQGVDDLPARLPPPAQEVAFSAPFQSASGDWLVLAVAPAPSGERVVGAFSTTGLARQALSGVATEQSTLILVSAAGDVLHLFGTYHHAFPVNQHPGVAAVLRGESGVDYTTEDSGEGHSGGEHVVSFSPVPPLGWGLVMEEAWEEIASPLLRTTQSAPLVLAPVLVLALFALWFGARQIVQPLQQLESRAARLAGGDFQAIREPAGGISEIRRLQDVLIETAAALEAAQEALHGYIGALTEGVENERRALARELHDDTLQALIALNQQVQMAGLQAANLPPGADDVALRELQSRITQTIANLRRAIGGLRPIYLEDLGLAAALGMLIRDAQKTGSSSQPPPEIQLHVRGEEKRLPAETELALYRITQEALNNALSHGGAGRVNIELDFTGSGASMSVTDDGQGFQVPEDPNAFARQGHYGLLGMRERAELAGAQMEIRSAPGQGTRVRVTC